MKQQTILARTARMSRSAAIFAAVIAGVGTAIGLSKSGEILMPILIGIGLVIVLAVGWHIAIKSAEKSRTDIGIVGSIAAALLLTAIAIGSSSWSLATAIGGKSALIAEQQEALSRAETELDKAAKRVAAQQGLSERAQQAAATYRNLADQERLGFNGSGAGCGRRCRIYQSVAADYERMATNIRSEFETLERQRTRGLTLLQRARIAISSGKSGEFTEALTEVSGVVGILATADLSKYVIGVGTITTDDLPGIDQLNEIDREMRQFARDAVSDLEAISLPPYYEISEAEAVIKHAGRVIGAWIVSVAIDISPLVLFLYVLILAREPLAREDETPEDVLDTNEKIRVREDDLNKRSKISLDDNVVNIPAE